MAAGSDSVTAPEVVLAVIWLDVPLTDWIPVAVVNTSLVLYVSLPPPAVVTTTFCALAEASVIAPAADTETRSVPPC